MAAKKKSGKKAAAAASAAAVNSAAASGSVGARYVTRKTGCSIMHATVGTVDIDDILTFWQDIHGR